MIGRERTVRRANPQHGGGDFLGPCQAAKLGVTPSALSHTIRYLEARLKVRLLALTTRNVTPTEAAEKLMRAVSPLFDQIAEEVQLLGELRDEPAGTIRLTCSDDAAQRVLRPMLAGFLAKFPDIQVEISIDYGFKNIVSVPWMALDWPRP
jgi:DNA-binding transcriptional LysR family regulator